MPPGILLRITKSPLDGPAGGALNIRVALLCLVAVLLSACGGGGGDGGGGGSTPPPPPPPPPAFALTEANAVQAAAYALAPLEQLLSGGSLAVSITRLLRLSGAPQFTFYCAAMPSVQINVTYTDRDASGNMSVGDVIDVPATDCYGFRKLTITLTQLSATLDQIAGQVEIDTQVDPPGMQVVGSFGVSLSLSSTPPEATWRITNVAVTVTQANTTQTVRVASSQLVSTPTAYTLSVTGGSVDSGHLGGSYTFATTTPFAGAVRRLPGSGELALSASAGSRVRVMPPATPGSVEETVEYAVAATSSGPFASTQQTMWTAIIRGSLFSWRPNVAPTLTSLSIQPPNPSPGVGLWVNYFAQDANGDPLQTTIEWRRNSTVVGNTQFLNITTVRNDQISVTVTVSDGRGLTAMATTSITIGNPGPTLNLTVTPPLPDTSVDLVAVPSVFEPDGDPVTLTYEWSRNDTVIANHTTDTLPASETTRGDTISVRVTASDGASTVERTASVTIIDSPPRVSVLSPPTTVAHGAPVTFTAAVTDADGDPVVGQVDFLLAYGPAGMAVDADTGVVNWTAGGPMFDRTMDVGWGITLDDSSAQPATGTITVTDSSRDYPLLRFGTKIPTWPAGLSVGDFDDDGDVEVLVQAERWLYELESDGAGGYRQSWAHPYSLNRETQYSYNSSKASVATGDVDGDDRHEIFTAVGSTITKLDGVERRPVATRQLTDAYAACADLLYGDLENDGAPELLCLSTTEYWSTTARILVLRASDLSVRDEALPQANYGRSFALGNVDADAAIEIVTSGGYVFHGPTFENEWLYTPGFGSDVDTGDLDGDGIEEIVAAADSATVRGYSATLRSPIWEVQRSYLDSLLVADVGGDARPEIIVGDAQWGELVVYRYNEATNTADLLSEVDSQEHGVTSIGVGDLDDDGTTEIIWGSGYSSSGSDVLAVASLSPTLTIEWTNENSAPLDAPFVGGELAGNAIAPRAPLFLSGSTSSFPYGSRLVRMPADGNLDVSELFGTSYYGNDAVDIVDYDNDSTDEAFIGSGNPYWDELFRVYDFFGDTTEWTSGADPDYVTAVDVTHAELTGDGRAELVGITSAGVVYVHNVFGQTLVWQSTTLNEGRKVLVANVDGDAGGELEIVAVTRQNVFVYRRNAPPIPYVQIAAYPATNRYIVDADVGDTDGDGDVEIVLLVGTSYSQSGNEIVTLNGNLQPQTIGTFTLPWDAQTLAIEPSGAPRKNLIVSRLAGPQYFAYDGILAIVDGRSGGVVFESRPLTGAIQRDSIHYVTLPGETVPRISIGTSAGMYLTR